MREEQNVHLQFLHVWLSSHNTKTKTFLYLCHHRLAVFLSVWGEKGHSSVLLQVVKTCGRLESVP
jgi:hypothetical protein